MGSIINPNERQTWAISAQGVTIMGKTKSYNTYEEMLRSSDPGLINYVTDASGDPTVKSGFAVYRYSNGIFTKIYEGEMMDQELGVTFEWSTILNGPKAAVEDIDAAAEKCKQLTLNTDEAGLVNGLLVNGILLATDEQIKVLEGKVSGALHFKGVVENKEALPAEGNTQGDVYVDKAGKEYVYVDGVGFEEFGSLTDLTSYYTKDEIAALLVGYLPLTDGKFSGLVYMQEAATTDPSQNIVVLGSNAIMNRISIGQQDPTGFDADKLYSFKYFEAGPKGMKGFVDQLKALGVPDAITGAIRTNGVQIQDTGKKISDIPFYQTFQNSNDPAPRKTIQLANHDTISGIKTDGSGVNIAMVSKWDKVDLGSATIQMNLNSLDGKVQVNDEEIVLTDKNYNQYITTVACKFTEEEKTKLAGIEAGAQVNVKPDWNAPAGNVAEILNKPAIPSIEGLATEDTVNAAITEVDAKIAQETEDRITADNSLTSAIGLKQDAITVDGETLKLQNNTLELGSDVVVMQNPWDPELPNRRHIVLKNHDSIVGTMTTGNNGTLIMMSKWDKVDVGTTQAQMNLNSPNGVVQVNDEAVVVTSANINEYAPATDLSGYYTKVEVDAKIAGVLTYKGTLDTVEALDSVEAPKTGDVYHITATGAEYAYNGTEWEELGSEVDLSAYATTASVAGMIDTAKEDLGAEIDAEAELRKSADDALDGRITTLEVDLSTATEELEEKIALKQDKINLGEGTPNVFVITNADGTIKASQYKMGGSVLADTATANTAASELAVKTITDGLATSITDAKDEAVAQVKTDLGVSVVNSKVRFSQDKFPGMLEVSSDHVPEAGDFAYLNNDAHIPHVMLDNLEIILDGIFKGPDYTPKANDQALGNIVFHTAPTTTQPLGGAVVVNSTNGLLFIDTDEYASPSALVTYLKTLGHQEQLQFIQNHMVITPDGKIADRALNIDLSVYAKSADVNTSLDGKVDKVTGKSLVSDTEIARLAGVDNYDDTVITAKVDTVEGQVVSVTDRLASLEAQIVSLKQTDVAAVTSSADLAQADKDLIITIAEPISGTTTVEGKSIEVKQLTTNNATTVFKTEGDVTMKNLNTTGNLPKATANAQIRIVSGEYVRITDSAINQTGYNAVEIGLGTGSGPSATKSIVIDNVKFNSTLTNNAISIFATEDGSVITISNCVFTKCSNPVRLSNATGGKVTINLVNCEFTEWDSNPDWAGILIMQDYTSGSEEAIQTNNLFGPDKVTINVINCTHNGQKIVAPENIASVCGTKDQATQLFYIWSNEEGFVAYDAERYPVINIQ